MSTPGGRVAVLVALVAASLALRPQLAGIGPLLPSIRDDLGLSHAAAGLLVTIPVLCMGVFAFAAGPMLRTFGLRGACAICLAAIAAAGFVRAAAPGAVGVLALTVPFGVAAGCIGALLPAVVKDRFAQRPGLATGTYSIGINLGSTIAAASAIPLALLLGSWRGSLAVFAVLGAASLPIWLLLTRGQLSDGRAGPRSPIPWGRAAAWAIAVLFGLQALCFWGLNAWLAQSYVERGWSEGAAGALVGGLNAASLPGTLLVALLADRVVPRRTYLVVSSGILTVALVALVAAPGTAWPATMAAGAACGSLFPLALTLTADASLHPAETGAVGALVLAVGYSISALAPFALGAARDATGSFTASLAILAGAALVLVALSLLLSPRRLEPRAAAVD